MMYVGEPMGLVRKYVIILMLVTLVTLSLAISSEDANVVSGESSGTPEEFVKDGILYQPLNSNTCTVTGTVLLGETVLTIPEQTEDKEGNIFKVVSLQKFAIEIDSLVELYLPATIEKIPGQAILSHHLEILEVDINNPNYKSADNNIYSKDGSTLVFVNPASTGTMIVRNEVTNLSPEAFSHCNLSKIQNLPQMTVIPERLFGTCENLTEFQFRGCDPNTVPEGTLMIGASAFMETSINEIHLPDSLKVIEYLAFAYNDAITSITIPPEVYYLGDYVFIGCDSLGEIQVEEGNETYFSEGGVLFKKYILNQTEIVSLEQYPADKPQESYIIPAKVSKINTSAFSFVKKLKTVEFGNSIQIVDMYSFMMCHSLEKVILNDSILIIDEGAFDDCENLSEIVMSENLQSIREYAFMDCKSLTSVTFPDSLDFIGECAFMRCDLRHLEFSENLKNIGENAFFHNTNLTDVKCNGTINLGKNSFDTCSEKVTITIPKSMSIDKDVFGSTPYEIQHIGDRPFPISNIFGIAVCLLILAGIVYLFRRI